MKNFNIIPADENSFEFRIDADSTVEILESDIGCHAEVETDRPELFNITADEEHFVIERIDQPSPDDFLGAILSLIRNRNISGLKKFSQERASVRVRIFTAAGRINLNAVNSTVLVRRNLELLRLKSANLNFSNEGLIRELELKANNAVIELNLGREVSDWQIRSNNSGIRLHTNGFGGTIRSSFCGNDCSRSFGSGDGLVSIRSNNGNLIID
ncbi:MAG: hypothetical protein SPL25_06515 [Succinivibrionaceae bacterium]|nr:hypothetical protein [Succinivibrionaceae bacterium]